MKLIIAILLLVLTSFAQNTKYKNGSECHCDSIHSDYYDSGELFGESPYVNGEQHGIITMYAMSGVLVIESPYVNGEQHGIRKFYYKSGALQYELPYVNGKKHGIEKWYHENGTVACNATYKNDELVGYKTCANGRVGNESLDCFN